MGLVSVVSRIGAATAPFVVQMIRINAVLPFAMMGVLTLLAAFLCWFLPETKNRPTAEVFGDDGQKGEIQLLVGVGCGALCKTLTHFTCFRLNYANVLIHFQFGR